MSLIVPRWHTYDTDAAQPDPLALSLLSRVQPEFSRFWDLIPFAAPITGLNYEMASRAPEANTVVSTTTYTTGSSTTITFDTTTRKRLTTGHILYHPATKQVFVISDMNVSSGVATLERIDVQTGSSAANVASGQTYYRIGNAENYDEINATSRFGSTATETNYVQENLERLDFSTTFLRQPLQWGLDKQMLIDERTEDYVKDLNMNLYYGIKKDEASGQRSATQGFDEAVAAAGNNITAASSGTADLEDLATVARFLQDNGAGAGAGTVLVARPDVYDEYDIAGLVDFTSSVAPEDQIYVGQSIKGVTIRGVRYPFYPDPTLLDTDVRFCSTKYARKGYYQDEAGEVWSPKVRKVERLSDFKVEVNVLVQRWGTIWMQTDNVHAKLVTGL